MKAIVISRVGGPEVLELREVPTPEPSRGEALVRVRATAVNRADLLQRMGRYPAPSDAPSDIPGIEFAGEIESLGPGVEGWRVGDRVLGVAGGGTYADRLVVHARTLARVPEGMSWSDAAAIPEAFITAYDAMVTQGGLAPGESVLIHAVASGVGSAAVQIARAIGARTCGTSRSSAKLERAAKLGLDHAIVPDGGQFASRVREVVGKQGVDLVLELVGGAYVAEDLACVAMGGRIVLVGLLGGTSAQLDLGAILSRRVVLRGTVLRSRPLEEKIALARTFARHVIPLFETGRLVPVVDRVFPLREAAAAQRHMASNESLGKIVLDCSE